MSNPNENCLKGKRCPKCGSYGPFAILAEAWFKVDDTGTCDAEDVSWDNNHLAICSACNYKGKFGTFDDPETKENPDGKPEKAGA